MAQISKKLRSFFTDRANLFVINIFLVYGAWKVLIYYVKSSSGTLHFAWMKLTYLMGAAYAAAVSWLLNLLGEHTFRQGIVVVFAKDLANIHVDEHCLAIPASIVFIGTIALFKGNWKSKVWFIPLGVFLISFINLLRIASLCFIFEHFSSGFYRINHKVVVVVLTYGLILLMIVWWIRKFETSDKNLNENVVPNEITN